MTDTRRVQIVDAFTEEPMAGNPAGVVPDATDLTDDQMAAVANELGASETAFVRPSETADRRLRYFTPEREVDLCGHATVATFASLYDRAVIASGTHTVETDAGVLDVEVEPDGRVWLTQSAPEVSAVDLELDRVADALGLDAHALTEVGEDLPVGRASTGLPFLVVPVGYFQQLSAIEPDLATIEELCREVEAEGLYAFTFDTLESDATLHGRAFVPLAGIPEDPVTGTASGAVGAYLRHHDALDQSDPLVFEQGHFVDRPGRVLVETGYGEGGSGADDEDADRDDGGGTADSGVVRVGGHAVTTVDGDVSIPPADEDDIIEA